MKQRLGREVGVWVRVFGCGFGGSGSGSCRVGSTCARGHGRGAAAGASPARAAAERATRPWACRSRPGRAAGCHPTAEGPGSRRGRQPGRSRRSTSSHTSSHLGIGVGRWALAVGVGGRGGAWGCAGARRSVPVGRPSGTTGRLPPPTAYAPKEEEASSSPWVSLKRTRTPREPRRRFVLEAFVGTGSYPPTVEDRSRLRCSSGLCTSELATRDLRSSGKQANGAASGA